MAFGRYFMLVHFTLTTLLTYSYQESIDCKTSTPMVQEGQPAAITCTFPEIRDFHGTLNLRLKKDGSQSSAILISTCKWSNTSSSYEPQDQNGYVVTCPTTQGVFVMRILIPRAQKSESGNYLCNIQGGGKSEKPCLLEVKDASIVTTCQSTSVQEGKNASLIYYFNKDILSTKPDITVIRDSVKFHNNNQPNNITVLDIWWKNGTLISSGLHEDRYNFKLNGTTLAVYIQSALETDQGRYTCTVHGSEQLPASSCYLTLSEEKNNEVCSVQTDQCSGNSTFIMSIVILSIVSLLALCVLIYCICTRTIFCLQRRSTCEHCLAGSAIESVAGCIGNLCNHKEGQDDCITDVKPVGEQTQSTSTNSPQSREPGLGAQNIETRLSACPDKNISVPVDVHNNDSSNIIAVNNSEQDQATSKSPLLSNTDKQPNTEPQGVGGIKEKRKKHSHRTHSDESGSEDESTA